MLQHPDFDPVALSIGPVKVHWYGLMYVLAFASAWWLARKRAARPGSPMTVEQVEDLIFWGAIGVVLGGRLGYVLFYGWDRFVDNPLWALRVWEGGMSFHGGLLGVIIMVAWFAHRQRISIARLLDFVAPITPLGLGFGRLGNFIGQELWGRPTDLPIGMLFPRDPLALARHPSQLYQALLEGLLLFLLVWVYSARPRPAWAVSGVFLCGYGVFRFVVEFAREPDAHIGFIAFGWLTKGQLLSLPMIIGGLILVYWAYHQERQRTQGI